MIRSEVNALGIATAVILMSYAFSASPPHEVYSSTQTMLANAAVSISAGVEQNSYNTVADQLQKKEAELMEREERLAHLARERSEASDFAVYSFIASIILTLLVALNFFFDWRRIAKNSGGFSLDLRRKS